jgi:DNA-binding LytR/AlgR family response regulator
MMQHDKLRSMKHIAIVDDESTLRDNLSYALDKEGYRVSSFPNGQDAWEAYRDNPPHLYVLDILMPRMDGLEFAGCCAGKTRKRRSFSSHPGMRNSTGSSDWKPEATTISANPSASGNSWRESRPFSGEPTENTARSLP